MLVGFPFLDIFSSTSEGRKIQQYFPNAHFQHFISFYDAASVPISNVFSENTEHFYHYVTATILNVQCRSFLGLQNLQKYLFPQFIFYSGTFFKHVLGIYPKLIRFFRTQRICNYRITMMGLDLIFTSSSRGKLEYKRQFSL